MKPWILFQLNTKACNFPKINLFTSEFICRSWITLWDEYIFNDHWLKTRTKPKTKFTEFKIWSLWMQIILNINANLHEGCLPVNISIIFQLLNILSPPLNGVVLISVFEHKYSCTVLQNGDILMFWIMLLVLEALKL